MLSILIPIYNINCVKLVTGLQAQCGKAGIPFEILCYDDGSISSILDQNSPLSQLFGVSYVEMKENRGRAAIRNVLGKYSNFENLLFIDADSRLPNKSFIRNYLPYLNRKAVVYGGRAYNRQKPAAVLKQLHWTYGSKREALPAKNRNRAPYLNFMSNNFILPRTVFEKITFDPKHEGYGYEDTLFATELHKNGIPLLHVDNPLIHSGLETAPVFLEKTREAMKNLAGLYAGDRIVQTRLIRAYEFLNRWGLIPPARRYLEKRIESITGNLERGSTHLRLLDEFKLYHFLVNVEKTGTSIP